MHLLFVVHCSISSMSHSTTTLMIYLQRRRNYQKGISETSNDLCEVLLDKFIDLKMINFSFGSRYTILRSKLIVSWCSSANMLVIVLETISSYHCQISIWSILVSYFVKICPNIFFLCRSLPNLHCSCGNKFPKEMWVLSLLRCHVSCFLHTPLGVQNA